MAGRLKNCHFKRWFLLKNRHFKIRFLLSTSSSPKLLYTEGDDRKSRRWHLPSHNINISVYWSPFLVKGVEKTERANFNTLYLDSASKDWASDLDQMDMIVFSVGYWFLHSTAFYGEEVLGCYFCKGQNYIEVGFYDVFGKAMKTTLKTIIERKGGSERGIDVMVTTFSPHHFEGEWDKLGACPKTRPYKEGEKEVEGMDFEMRKAEVEQVEAAKVEANNGKFLRLRFEALDVDRNRVFIARSLAIQKPRFGVAVFQKSHFKMAFLQQKRPSEMAVLQPVGPKNRDPRPRFFINSIYLNSFLSTVFPYILYKITVKQKKKVVI